MKGAGLFYPNMVEIQCVTGHWRPEAKRILKCNENGTWVPAPSPCRKIVCNVSITNVIQISVNSLPSVLYGGEVKYGCSHGQRLTSRQNLSSVNVVDGTVTATCTDPRPNATEPLGEFVPYPGGFFCKAITCPVPSQPKHGHANWNDTMFQSLVEYACNTGYKLNGQHKSHCGKNGQWSSLAPSCDIVHCPMPNHPRNGSARLSSNSTAIGSEVVYSCDSGFSLYGTSTSRRCRQDGSWSGFEPSCTGEAVET